MADIFLTQAEMDRIHAAVNARPPGFAGQLQRCSSFRIVAAIDIFL
jgi:hypothetical protein